MSFKNMETAKGHLLRELQLPANIRIGLCGASGKMGKIISTKIEESNACVLSSTFSSKNTLHDFANFCQNCEVIIDFSNATILEELLKNALLYQKKIVIGTTGLTKEHLSLIEETSKELAILHSANMSLGANLLTILAEKAAKILDKNYDIEIVECHHRMKKDAPSGTALMIGDAIAKAKKESVDRYIVVDRAKQNTIRDEHEIGIASLRGGQVNGIHEVYFLGNNENLSIKHQALDKGLFAEGAIKAAIWLYDKPPGLYSMRDVLSIDFLHKSL